MTDYDYLVRKKEERESESYFESKLDEYDRVKKHYYETLMACCQVVIVNLEIEIKYLKEEENINYYQKVIDLHKKEFYKAKNELEKIR